MSPHGSGQHDGLEVSALAREFGHRIAVGHTRDLLIEDRALVEFLGHVVRRRADEFHPSIVGLAVGVGSDEGREERVMDVDDPGPIGVDELGGQNLHVASQHHQIDVE